MPAYAKHVIGVDARGLGFLLGAVGVGAICGSLLTAFVGARRRGLIWFASACVMACGSIALGFVHTFGVALGVLVFMGLSVMSFTGSSNVLLQSLSPEDMRGRSISVFAMIVLGGVPAGSLLVGSVATFIGLQAGLALGGATFLAIVIAVWATNARLRAT
jgi:predicted MFS family arabinose efflux permease